MSVVTWDVSRETSSCVSHLPSHSISPTAYHVAPKSDRGLRRKRCIDRAEHLRLDRHYGYEELPTAPQKVGGVVGVGPRRKGDLRAVDFLRGDLRGSQGREFEHRST